MTYQLTVIFLMLSSIGICQVNWEGGFNFKAVVEAPMRSKSELYNQGKMWFVDNFASPDDVIVLDDKESGVLVGKGNTKINITVLGRSNVVRMRFTLKLEFKAGKYRYKLYDIAYWMDDEYVPCERVLGQKRKNGKPRSISSKYELATLNKLAVLKENLEGYLAKSEKQSSNDW